MQPEQPGVGRQHGGDGCSGSDRHGIGERFNEHLRERDGPFLWG